MKKIKPLWWSSLFETVHVSMQPIKIRLRKKMYKYNGKFLTNHKQLLNHTKQIIPTNHPIIYHSSTKMSYSSNYDLSPKSNDSLSSSLDNNFNSWSPFSTPCFSPYPGSNYAQLPSANNFQYSYVSDQMNTRRAIKSIPSQGL
jgi:hypothetical protein